MSDKYKIRDNEKPYFVTMTTVGWVDVFTRREQKLVITDSLQYCQKNKGLVIFAYCLMPSHLHMICMADDGYVLSDILRDLKKHTSKVIIYTMQDMPESRREWMVKYFAEACAHLKRKQDYKVWQDGNHCEEIFTNNFLYEKLEYIHNNPVEDMIVENPEDYLFSSARNYACLDGIVNVEILTPRLVTYS